MKDDTQPEASKATYVQSENIVHSLEFKEANFNLETGLFFIFVGDLNHSDCTGNLQQVREWVVLPHKI